MWISEKLSKENSSENNEKISSGVVTSGGEIMIVKANGEKRAPELLLPYGYVTKVPVGERAGVLGEFNLGISPSREKYDKSLSEGEVIISSKGGAEIILKNTGEVFINGQRFAPKAK